MKDDIIKKSSLSSRCSHTKAEEIARLTICYVYFCPPLLYFLIFNLLKQIPCRQFIYFQLPLGHREAPRHRCSRFPLDSILSHTRTHHTETSSGRRKCLESGDNYVTAIKQTRSTYAMSQFVTVLHPSITWTDAELRKYYLPPVFKGSIPFHPPPTLSPSPPFCAFTFSCRVS